MKKATLQVISELIEDYKDLLDDGIEFSEDNIYVLINEEHLDNLINDEFASMFCIKYVEDDFNNTGAYCNFTGVDIVLDKDISEIEIISK